MSVTLDPSFLRLHATDNIAIAKRGVEEGTPFELDAGEPAIVTRDLIPLGHKVAVRQILQNEPVRKFGQLIGYATCDIQPGQWVHSHNLYPGELSLDYAFATDVPPDPVPILG